MGLLAMMFTCALKINYELFFPSPSSQDSLFYKLFLPKCNGLRLRIENASCVTQAKIVGNNV